MASDTIIFEAAYVSELTEKMNAACALMGEAVQRLKKASLHEGWKCKECAKIAEQLTGLNARLGKLDGAVNEITRVLGGSVSRFEALEAEYASQAENISDYMRENHGYTASVYQPSTGGSASGSQDVATSGGASGTEAAAGVAGAVSAAGRGIASSVSSAGNVSVVISGTGQTASQGQGAGQSSSGVSSGVNLPVTHIPDRPDAVAKGTKNTSQIAEAAVSSVAGAIAETLGVNPSQLTSQLSAGTAAKSLVEAYNAGKTIVENSASIASSPSMPHVREHIAIAGSLARLADSSAVSVASSSSVSESPNVISVSASSSSGGTSYEAVKSNAGYLFSYVSNESNGDELGGILESLTSSSADSSVSSGSSGGGQSFFEMILAALISYMTGEESGSSSASLSSGTNSSSPVQEFLSSLITESA